MSVRTAVGFTEVGLRPNLQTKKYQPPSYGECQCAHPKMAVKYISESIQAPCPPELLLYLIHNTMTPGSFKNALEN